MHICTSFLAIILFSTLSALERFDIFYTGKLFSHRLFDHHMVGDQQLYGLKGHRTLYMRIFELALGYHNVLRDSSCLSFLDVVSSLIHMMRNNSCEITNLFELERKSCT